MRHQKLTDLRKTKKRKKNRIPYNQIFLIWTFFIFLLLSLIFIKGDKGYLHFRNLRNTYTQLKSQNKNIEEENKRLLIEIKNLKENPDYIERLAREELGLAKKDEIIFQITQKNLTTN
ncbi:MAG: septum formation initiator family protein [bacterium]